jgi:hypothetical protein
VIAAGKDFDAGMKEFVGEARSDTETGGGVFAVGDAQINLLLGEDVREPIVNDAAAGRANDVADEENAHRAEQSMRRSEEKSKSGREILRFAQDDNASQEEC